MFPILLLMFVFVSTNCDDRACDHIYVGDCQCLDKISYISWACGEWCKEITCTERKKYHRLLSTPDRTNRCDQWHKRIYKDLYSMVCRCGRRRLEYARKGCVSICDKLYFYCMRPETNLTVPQTTHLIPTRDPVSGGHPNLYPIVPLLIILCVPVVNACRSSSFK